MNVCLVVIFNHRYENNLQVLRDLYKDRFRYIRFLMPFYTGNDPDVIPVYESSHMFQGFLAQGKKDLLQTDCDYFFFISDDLILNPDINENNFMSELSINPGEALISGVFPLQKSPWMISRVYENTKLFYDGHTLFQNELMSKNEAMDILRNKGYDDFTITYADLKKKPYRDGFIRKYGLLNLLRFYKRREMPYPLVGGYSDWFVLSKMDFDVVSDKLGVTAAMGLFVEIAIPTIVMLYCRDVRFLKQTKYMDGSIWSGEEVALLEERYDNDLNKLLADFPKQKLFIHPIKLSKWKYECRGNDCI